MKGPTRRQVLGTAAALATAPWWPRWLSAADILSVLEASAAGAATTLDRRIVLGGTSGFRPLRFAAGEPHLVRVLGGAHPDPARTQRRRSLLCVAHFTDVHLVDTQSPARVEFLDRTADPPAPANGPFSAAFRPHEVMSTHVAAAMTEAIRQIGVSPVTGRAIDLVVSTGDAIDNQHFVELRWLIDILDGGTVAPDTGTPGYQGVQDGVQGDVAYYHPEDPAHDDYGSVYGYPQLHGLLAAAMRPFTSPGLGMPWIAVFGNHDGLLQGNAPSNPAFEAIATGPLKPTTLPVTYSATTFYAAYSANPAALLTATLPRVVGADARRTVLSHQRYIAEHFTTSGTPAGHGFTTAGRDADIGYYVHDASPTVRLLALDTLNRGGYNDGSIDQTQLAWLTARLVESSSRYVDTSGAWTTHATQDRLLVVLSHHTSSTMENPTEDPARPGPRVNGGTVVSLLQRFPNVVAWVNGHTHVNKVTPHAGIAGTTPGFWEINTAAHIDWPEQTRLVEVVDNRDGTLSIFGTVVDHAGGLAIVPGAKSFQDLAATSRVLSANDIQKGAVVFPVSMGAVEDRNVELMLPAPFDLSQGGTPVPSANPTSSGGTSGGGGPSPGLVNTAGEVAGGGDVVAAAVLGAAVALTRRRRQDGG